MEKPTYSIGNKFDDKHANELISRSKMGELVKQIKIQTEVLSNSFNDLTVVKQFKVGKKYWDTNKILKKKEKKRLEILAASFPNVEILTYDHIIQKAQSTLDFWKRYESGIMKN